MSDDPMATIDECVRAIESYGEPPGVLMLRPEDYAAIKEWDAALAERRRQRNARPNRERPKKPKRKAAPRQKRPAKPRKPRARGRR